MQLINMIEMFTARCDTVYNINLNIYCNIEIINYLNNFKFFVCFLAEVYNFQPMYIILRQIELVDLELKEGELGAIV